MQRSLYVPVLVAGMLITGSANSLLTKYQDMLCVENCADPDVRNHVVYEQPVWQSLNMFVGEMGCFIPLIISWFQSRSASPPQLPILEGEEESASGIDLSKHTKMQGWAFFLFWLPAACDLTGTTLMNVGLLYTPVSLYQMIRGALVLFVGILSVLFLHRKLYLYQWFALATVMGGVGVVGWSGSLVKEAARSPLGHFISSDEADASRVLIGVFFVLFAQIFTAMQFVIEEKIMAKYSVEAPIAVGFEGLFGFISVLLVMPILSQFRDKSPFFDLPRGWHQMVDNPPVLIASCAIAVSIGLFNFFGLSVTRHISATARSVIDTCRTLTIWIISLTLGWEILVWPFSLYQVVGFSLLVYGTFLFNNLVQPPKMLHPPATVVVHGHSEEERGLLSERALDETAILPADVGTSGYDVVPPPPSGR